ncbi:MAG: hypothetical protein KAJ73_02245 [Zetaproteobacteria bacterium]|nr:hypothetical protein [Zetaproteobacteria bacterium]
MNIGLRLFKVYKEDPKSICIFSLKLGNRNWGLWWTEHRGEQGYGDEEIDFGTLHIRVQWYQLGRLQFGWEVMSYDE